MIRKKLRCLHEIFHIIPNDISVLIYVILKQNNNYKILDYNRTESVKTRIYVFSDNSSRFFISIHLVINQ